MDRQERHDDVWAILVGPAFAPYRGTDETRLNGHQRDTDGDGLIDGLEDVNRNGIFGLTHYQPGPQSEMVGEWPELNPGERDTDGDGLDDGDEVNGGRDIFNANRSYCLTLEKLYAEGSTLEQLLGNNTAQPTTTNPHVADSDGDGVLDAIDVDPRNPVSVMTIKKVTFQLLEQADYWSDYNVDLGLSFEVLIGPNRLHLDFGLLRKLDARSPRSMLELRPNPTPSGTMGNLFASAASIFTIDLPQTSSFYASPAQGLSASFRVNAFDDDAWSDDIIDLEHGEPHEFNHELRLDLNGGERRIASEGDPVDSFSLSSPITGRLAITYSTPFDNFLLERALQNPMTPADVRP